MKSTPAQTSFDAGEFSELLEGRWDIEKYGRGARRLINFLPTVYGPAIKRSRTTFVGEAKDSSQAVTLVPFIYSRDDAYVLEFGDRTLRFAKNGARVTFTPVAIVSSDNLNPARVVATAHGLATGDRVLIRDHTTAANALGVLLNNREFRVTVIDPDTVSLQHSQTGANIDGTTYIDGGAAGTIAKIYEIATPYLAADTYRLFLGRAQSWDVLYLAHPSYALRKLTRTGDTAFTLAEVAHDHPPLLAENLDPDKRVYFDDVPPATGTAKTGSSGPHAAITSSTNATPVVVTTTAAHGWVSGVRVWIDGISGQPTLNGIGYRITVLSSTTFSLDGTAAPGAAGTGGTAHELRSLSCWHSILETAARRITAMASNGGGGTRFTVLTGGAVTDHGFQNGDTVVFIGCEGKHQFNGRALTVTRINATQFDVTEAITANDANNGTYSTAYRRGIAMRVSEVTSFAVFQSGMVAGYFGLREEPGSFYTSWGQNPQVRTIGETVQYQGRIYTVLRNLTVNPSATSGTAEPTHDVPGSEAWDANPTERASNFGSRLRFEHNGHGYVRIGQYINAGLVYAYVPDTARSQNIPFGAVRKAVDSNALDEFDESATWSYGAFNDYEGHARTICFHESRLWLAGSNLHPQNLWASRTGDFENFRQSDEDESSLLRTLDTDESSPIEWLSPGRLLVAGTRSGEFLITSGNLEQAITTGNAKAPRHTTYGVRAVRPLRIDQALLFAQRAGRKILSYAFDFESDSYEGSDLTALSRHVTKGKVKALDFQQEPYRTVRVLMEDGTLGLMAHDRTVDVTGWGRDQIAGTAAFVESMCVIPHATLAADQVWMMVRRTISGGTARYLEFYEPIWEDGDLIADGKFADAGLSYSGAPTTSVFGLHHLRGETVKVLGDGLVQAEKTVSADGAVTGLTSASKFQIGLKYRATLQTMRLEGASAGGTSQGPFRRVIGFVVRLFQTGAGLLYGKSESPTNVLRMQLGQDPAGAAVSLLTGDSRELPWGEGFESEGRMTFIHEEPTPCTIVALIPKFETKS